MKKIKNVYYEDLMTCCDKNNILTFFFEAFDEAWKSLPDPNELEKHGGLFQTDRTPKIAMEKLHKQHNGISDNPALL